SGTSEALLRPLEIDPVQMFITVFILLGIPLVLGMVFNHKFPNTTKKILKPIRILSIIIFFGYVVMALKSNIDHFLDHIHYIFIIVLIHNAIALGTGFFLATATKVSRPNRRAISIETGIQNSGLALILLFNPKIFPVDLANGGMAFIAAWWGIWHILAGLTMATLWRSKKLNQ
ncbi:MAG: bile acid:sodium symporter family protein, partial [Bacteroidales bacterium]|nr:bile acid:sodium symporter family protein [Bacteroidales bacterium]